MTGGAHAVATERAGATERPGSACASCAQAMYENHNTRTCRLCSKVAHLGCGKLVAPMTPHERTAFGHTNGWLCKVCFLKTGREWR